MASQRRGPRISSSRSANQVSITSISARVAGGISGQSSATIQFTLLSLARRPMRGEGFGRAQSSPERALSWKVLRRKARGRDMATGSRGPLQTRIAYECATMRATTTSGKTLRWRRREQVCDGLGLTTPALFSGRNSSRFRRRRGRRQRRACRSAFRERAATGRAGNRGRPRSWRSAR